MRVNCCGPPVNFREIMHPKSQHEDTASHLPCEQYKPLCHVPIPPLEPL